MSTSAPVESTSARRSTPPRETPPKTSESVSKPAESKTAPPQDKVETSEQDEPPGHEIGGLVEGIKSWASPLVHAVDKRLEKVEAQHDKSWDDPQDAMRNLKQNGDLTTYSNSQLNKLDVLGQVSPRADKTIERKLASTVNRADSLDDLPNSRGFQSMLQREVVNKKPDLGDALRNVTEGPNKVERAQAHLENLTDQAVQDSLDSRLEGKEGDSEAESAMQDWGKDLRSMAREDPALYPMLRDQARQEATSGETEERLKDIAEADDTLWDDARGTLGDVAGLAADNIPFLGSAVPGGGVLKHVPVVGEGVEAIDGARSELIGKGGNWLGDRAGDLVRMDAVPGPDSALGSAVQLLGGDGEKVDHDMRGGLGNFTESTVKGLAGAVADPGATARGGVDLALRVPNPVRSLVEGTSMAEQAEHDSEFWDALGRSASREYEKTSEEYGTLGAVTQIAAEAALTVGTGGGEGAVIKGLKMTRLASAARAYEEFGSLSHVLPKLENGIPTRAVSWANRYQDLNDPLRRSVGKVRGEAAGSAETADDKEDAPIRAHVP